MSHEARLIVETGPCKGRKFVIEDGGSARAGRSSSSDIPLNDPSVSRFHCRIFFKPGKGLWIADLGSANHTLVNGKAVQEERLQAGDRIAIGDSVLAVVSDASDKGAAVKPDAASIPPAPPASRGAIVDLGLAATNVRQKGAKPNTRLILLLLSLMVMSVLVVWIFFFWKPSHRKPTSGRTDSGLAEFELRYEKVDGSLSNIFQCVLVIRGNRAGIEFHDVSDKKHFKKPHTEVDPKVIAEMLTSIQKTGVLALPQVEYVESSRNTYNLRDLTVLMGTNSCRVKVLNAAEPPEFENARKILEAFGENEFSITSWAYPRGELVRLANESMRLGLKLYDEKNVSHGNLFKASRAINKAILDLETVDPKPDFYGELVASKETYDKELKDKLKDLWFQAELATRSQDWQEAVNVLRILCDTVPDRSNKDYKKAEAQLTDAERRIRK